MTPKRIRPLLAAAAALVLSLTVWGATGAAGSEADETFLGPGPMCCSG